MPKIEPMFASGTVRRTFSSRHLMLSITSMKSIRSWRSFIGMSRLSPPKESFSPLHRPSFLPSAYS